MSRAAVFGAGSWGTAFALVLADAGTDAIVWGRRPELCASITDRHENPDYLQGVALPPAVRATSDAAEALDGADIVVFALPAQAFRANLVRWVPLVPTGAVLMSLMKGIELGSTERMTQVIVDVVGADAGRVAALSGPNLAHEIAARQPAAAVVACPDQDVAEQLQAACLSPAFRPYTNTDVVGVEVGGAVKNVIALACGMAEGLGFGDNTKASIITRGLAETTRLGLALGADPQTFAGLAGLGDLVATCTSPLSRNRSFGEELGRGHLLGDIAAGTRQVAEGVKSCESVLALATAQGVEMPIVEHVVAVVRDGVPAAEMGRSLMSRAATSELRRPG